MDKKRNITVCVAWPYANNNLHIGHVSSLLAGDLLARYHRMKGDNVLMVGGTDSWYKAKHTRQTRGCYAKRNC